MEKPATLLTFSDDSSENALHIDAFLWGEDRHICSLRSAIEAQIKAFQDAHGEGFLGFHANKVGDSKWATYQPYYDSMLASLKQMLQRNVIGGGLLIQSESALRNRTDVFKETLKSELQKPDSAFSKVLNGIEKEDYPVLYHRYKNLLPFVVLRGSALKSHDYVRYFPDSSGKWLQYADVERPLQASDGTTGNFKFFTINAMLARGLAKTLEGLGVIGSGPEILSFEPRADEQEPILQLCDALANFALATARTIVGIEGDGIVGKVGCLTNCFPQFEAKANLSTVLVESSGKVTSAPDDWFRVVDLKEAL
jgi:hypothetical protein